MSFRLADYIVRSCLLVFPMLLCGAGEVLAQPLLPMAPITPEQIRAEAQIINGELKDLRLLIEKQRPKAVRIDIPWGVDDPKAPVEGKLTFTTPGDRRQHFALAVTFMCKVNTMVKLLRSVSQSMELFEPAESKKVGNWLHIVEGAAVVAGGGVALAGQLTNSDPAKATGLALIGGGGIFAILKSTGLFKIELVKESVMRVEFNRQFGMMIRQQTASSDALSKTCTTLIEYSKDFLPKSTQDTLTDDSIKQLKQGIEQFYILQTALLQIGTAAEQIYTDLKAKMGSESTKIPNNLAAIVENTKETREGFDRDRAGINFLLDRVLHAASAE